MPIDIEGWIEIRDNNNGIWLGIASLNQYYLLGGGYSEIIFGISKKPQKKSLFGNRGLPKNVSLKVKRELDSYKEFEKEESNFSFDELFGFSYLTYDEVLDLDIFPLMTKKYQWSNVMEKMKELHENGIRAENIRVIVWANW